MPKQSQAEMTFTQTADMLAEMVSMDTVIFPGLYQLVRVIMMKRVARPNRAWNMDLKNPIVYGTISRIKKTVKTEIFKY